MAKKLGPKKGAAKGAAKRTTTSDDLLTDSQRRAQERERKRAAADAANGGTTDTGADDPDLDTDEDEVDVDRLPINHQTLMQDTDVRLPPEATPREGKTSQAPPVSVPGLPAKQRARAASKSVLVEATQTGYYDLIRRRPGDVFMISDATYGDGEDVPEHLRGELVDFSHNWMRLARKGARERFTTPNQAIRREHDAILNMRHGGPFPSVDSVTGRPGVSSGQIPDTSGDPNPLED